MKKRVVSLMLVCVMALMCALSFAGCGNKDDGKEANTGNSADFKVGVIHIGDPRRRCRLFLRARPGYC